MITPPGARSVSTLTAPCAVRSQFLEPGCKVTRSKWTAPLAVVAQTKPSRQSVTIKAMQFTPASMTVKVGDTVVWTNADDRDHTIVASDGSFAISADGHLVTSDGKNVLGQGGSPIVLDPQGEQPVITRDGAITIAGTEAGRLGLATFSRANAMEKVGDNLWSATGQTPG